MTSVRHSNASVCRRLPACVLAAAAVLAGALAILYFNTFRKTSYSPVQPVEFSHQTHVGKLGMDCLACHTGARHSPQAGVPDTRSCLDCHRLVMRDSPKIEPVLRAADPEYPGYDGRPIHWIKVNRFAAHAHFNHQAHVTRGVGCAECHGEVSAMERITIEQNRGMRWCMECHRNPAPRLRPLETITTPGYNPEEWLRQNPLTNYSGKRISSSVELGNHLQLHWRIKPKTDCTTCHQ